MSELSQSLMSALRSATAEQHARLDKAAFFLALASHQLAIESYVGELKALAAIHAALENLIEASSCPRLSKVWEEPMRKTPLLGRDLAYFSSLDLRETFEAQETVLRVVDRMRLCATISPASVLGYLYVLEGSTLGGAVLRPQLAEAFGLSGGEGLAYISSYGREVRERWRGFSERMNRLDLDAVLQTQATQAARELFDGLAEIFNQLHPIKGRETRVATILNLEAGAHPITADPREIRAAIDAGEKTWNKYPYYEMRYGERGKKFTASDSAWIATLSTLHQDRVDQQVTWLSRLLASRGMPRFLLQEHLETLCRELSLAAPEKRRAYEKLSIAASRLAQSIAIAIPPARAQILVGEFGATAPREWLERIPEAGRLLVGAVGDQRSGVARAVDSLVEWLTDPTRFPDEWNAAARLTLSAAQADREAALV